MNLSKPHCTRVRKRCSKERSLFSIALTVQSRTLIHSIQTFSSKMSRIKALTIPHNGITRVLSTECGISDAISLLEIQQGKPHPQVKNFMAVWDTGASSSAISQKVADALGLIQTGWGFSDTASGTVKVRKYGINIILPSNVGFPSVKVSCNNMKVDVLIGMDIITRGDFCITNLNRQTKFTFQTPSTHSYDFKKELDKYEKIHETWKKHGNNKCPCGSGKTWENCHGR